MLFIFFWTVEKFSIFFFSFGLLWVEVFSLAVLKADSLNVLQFLVPIELVKSVQLLLQKQTQVFF